MTGLSKEQLEMLKPGSTARPAIPADMFAPMLSAEDAKILLCGLFPAGVDVNRLSPEARSEIRAAIDVILTRTAKASPIPSENRGSDD